MNFEKQHISDIKKYENQIKLIYASIVKSISKGASNVKITDKPFSFSNYPTVQKRVDNLIKRATSDIETVIIDGCTTEWYLANQKAVSDAAKMFYGVSVPDYIKKQYSPNNTLALQTFLTRTDNGMNLSTRVWNITNQLKTEIETAVDIAHRDFFKKQFENRQNLELELKKGIGSGISAQQMQKSVKTYLNNPNKLFRRVRDEHGNLQLSKNAKAFHPGRGVYRSSYKNALRLTATETNMAYRTADYLNIQNEPFVLGITIELSNNHTLNGKPFFDICDELQGNYPKDFKFIGWHPNCRCHVLTINASKKDFVEHLKTGKPIKGHIKDVPDNFKKWIEENSDRLENSSSLPYFVRDNEKYFPEIEISKKVRSNVDASQQYNHILLEQSQPAKLTPLQIAQARHKNRTQSQIDAIKNAWHEERSIKHYGNNVLNIMSGISDVDTSKLQSLIKTSDFAAIQVEAKALSKIGKEITNLKYLDNPLQVAKMYSMADAKTVNSAVETTLKKWNYNNLSLSEKRDKLDFEINWIDRNKKYSTWQVSQNAYKKLLLEVEKQIKFENYDITILSLKSFSTKSKQYKDIISKLETARKTENIKDLDFYINQAQKKQNLLVSKKRNGKLPVTLQELDTAIKEYSYYDKTLVKNQNAISKSMLDLFNSNDFGMDIDYKLLDSVYQNGFYNTFQSGTSNGHCGSTKTSGLIETKHARLCMSHRMFTPSKVPINERSIGLSKYVGQQFQRNEYEKYGHLLDRDKFLSITKNLTQYGDTQVRFKKQNVSCTWTFDDSLITHGTYFQPSSTSNPNVCSFNRSLSPSSTPELLKKYNSVVEWQNNFHNRYIELQYHGKLSIDDVESITFKENPTKLISKDLIQKLLDKKIDIFYLNSNRTKIIKYKP